MQLEEELLRQLGTKDERSRDRRENTLYSLPSDQCVGGWAAMFGEARPEVVDQVPV